MKRKEKGEMEFEIMGGGEETDPGVLAAITQQYIKLRVWMSKTWYRPPLQRNAAKGAIEKLRVDAKEGLRDFPNVWSSVRSLAWD